MQHKQNGQQIKRQVFGGDGGWEKKSRKLKLCLHYKGKKVEGQENSEAR